MQARIAKRLSYHLSWGSMCVLLGRRLPYFSDACSAQETGSSDFVFDMEDHLLMAHPESTPKT